MAAKLEGFALVPGSPFCTVLRRRVGYLKTAMYGRRAVGQN
jgi:hypothetical protein